MNALANHFPSELVNNVFGIDRFFNDLDSFGSAPSYPPHSVYEWADDDGNQLFRVDIAVAGFAKNDLSVSKEKDTILIAGEKTTTNIPDGATTRKSGIGYRNFKLKFKVMENIVVEDVSLTDGILSVTLKEVVPEEHRPITYEINGENSNPSLLLEGKEEG